MHHMARILLDQESQKIAGELAGSDSFLVKTAAALISESLEKVAFEDNMTIPDNPVLGAVRSYLQDHPPANMDSLKEMLAQILEQDLQSALAKGGTGPIEMEASRLRSMADVMRSRLSLMRYARELKQFQTEMAKEMQLSQDSPAAEGAMQLPAGVSPLGPQGKQGQQGQQGKQGPQAKQPQKPPMPETPMQAAAS